MKYIRTKERIIDITKCKEGFLCKQKCWQPEIGWLVYEKDIIKQADTIEELCDEFVMLCLHDENGNKTRPIIMNNLSLLIGYMDANYGYAICGAIWTEWGLKYVAKMNEKGELCLL